MKKQKGCRLGSNGAPARHSGTNCYVFHTRVPKPYLLLTANYNSNRLPIYRSQKLLKPERPYYEHSSGVIIKRFAVVFVLNEIVALFIDHQNC